jgi:isopenicillin-N N-acyltransferase-like protein
MPLARPIATCALALLALTARAEAPRRFTPAETAGARLYYQDNIPIAVLSGTPEEIGRQHAGLLADPAKQVLTFPKRFADEIGAGSYWPIMVFMGNALMTHAPEPHREEFAALAATSKLDAGEIAVGNTLLELRRMGCSALIVDADHSATGAPLFGRNFDFPTLGELDQYSIVFIVRPMGHHAFASLTFPAAIGVVSGMNDAGLAVATLDVYESADGSSAFNAQGTPLALVFRRILEECTTVAEAEKLLRAEKPTTWMNLAVCDSSGSAVFEITPAHIGRRDPQHGVLPCTNHFRTPGLAAQSNDAQSNEGGAVTAGASRYDSVSHCWRYPLLAAAADKGQLTVEQVREHLHAANQGEFTLQTMVFEPKELKLHVAFGPPPTSDDKLTTIDLAPLFAPESSP